MSRYYLRYEPVLTGLEREKRERGNTKAFKPIHAEGDAQWPPMTSVGKHKDHVAVCSESFGPRILICICFLPPLGYEDFFYLILDSIITITLSLNGKDPFPLLPR